MKFLQLLFSKSSQVPRWFILLFDIGLCAVAYILAVLTRFTLGIETNHIYDSLGAIPIVLLVKGVNISYFRLHSFVIRHTSVQDGLRIFYAMGVSLGFLFVIDAVHNYFPDRGHLFPLFILLLDFTFSTFFLAAFRVFVKLMYIRISSYSDTKKESFAIYGAGSSGLTTKRKLEQEGTEGIKVVAFFEDDDNHQQKILEGVNIFHGQIDLEAVLQRFKVKQMVIADPQISISKKQDIIERCLNLGVAVRTVPPVEKWINGELSFKQMKQVKIEDLIERDVIQLNKDSIGHQVNNKVILVTGAGGSIGSEMVRQLLKFKPKKLLCLDSSEIKLYELDAEIRDIHPQAMNTFAEIIVADITNSARMSRVFEHFHPDIIYHAAAYKHVPLMEENPGEAVRVNVNGTKILSEMAVNYGVERFVMVSTDKAVNPTNVMGASKRIAEIYVQSMWEHNSKTGNGKTKFITTRFGNVLGSSGSVIPKFRKQIEEGGPITVTHPDITRYFMTIPEACQLVLEAGNMGKGGEIFIFDMGKSTKIVDLAKKMVKLSGLTLGKDIQIVYSGLRPGEKIFEELLNDQENSLPTHHEKIMIGKVRSYDFLEVKSLISDLIETYNSQDNMVIVGKMKRMVPEFKSKNSIFESLDNDVTLPNSNDLQQMLMQ
ncbi:MAG: polysaccharide biosynthesis protein [Bacteroidetes bacterium B1(2017)]|nr:MAG: polysaccharide biosynthesis protein [Bacteroidetes bacterium B1(2017)]